MGLGNRAVSQLGLVISGIGAGNGNVKSMVLDDAGTILFTLPLPALSYGARSEQFVQRHA